MPTIRIWRRRLWRFLLFRPKKRQILIEAYLTLGFARILKGLPFSRALRILGANREETSYQHHKNDDAALALIGRSLMTMSRFTFWESKCLVLAMAGMYMLARRRIESTMYLGTARDHSTGNLIAHAWLRSGPSYVTGADEIEKYTVVAVFGKFVNDKK